MLNWYNESCHLYSTPEILHVAKMISVRPAIRLSFNFRRVASRRLLAFEYLSCTGFFGNLIKLSRGDNGFDV